MSEAATERPPGAAPHQPEALDVLGLRGLRGARPGWVRLRTLITLRWLAIGGQVAALIAARGIYDLDLPLGPAYTVIGAAAAANLALTLAFPETRRLSGGEAIAVISFDIIQLGALLSLTGGLHNPFALLILAPVTIAATVLSLRLTLALGAAAILLASALALWHVPLRTEAGQVLAMPGVFVTGFWVAIVVGVLFLGFYARRVTQEMQAMSEALLATQMALAREQKLTDLGGVVAAAAHELGTPLATIKLVSSELRDEIEDAELAEDAALIGQQADRCRDILRSMGRAGKDDRHMRHAPLGAVLREAAEPHAERGVKVHHHLAPMGGSSVMGTDPGTAAGGGPRQPAIARSPEIIHGLRNLVQNAVDFARASVWIEARWSRTEITVTITDDGPGYPPHVLSRIGDPFVGRGRRGLGAGLGAGLGPDEEPGPAPGRGRPGYEGMGLGLFIAKTLLERSGARLSFSNAGDPFGPHGGFGPLMGPQGRASPRLGARVSARWRRSALEAGDHGGPLGENARFEP